jgi:hypothetical protein
MVIGKFWVFVYLKKIVHYSEEQNKKLTLRALYFYLVYGKLYHQGQDHVLRCCFEDLEVPMVL